MVYAGVLLEGEAEHEVVSSLVGDPCVVDAKFFVGKDVASGHCIAMDSAQGMFLLAAAFSLR
jgi:hypothetical protein